MRDVIVVGAGGGGPVVAKELAGRGLDVLLLEAGPRHADPRAQWSRFENDANNPITGYFRFGPGDRTRPAWFRETPQNSVLLQLSGVGGTTKHYFGNSPRAYPGVFADYSGADAGAFDGAHRFPFGYEELVPYYEWVEATLPVRTAAMGTKEEVFLRGCEALDLPVQTTKTTRHAAYRPQENAILQPGGYAGRTTDPDLLAYPASTGCTFCGSCTQGCMQPRNAPRNHFAKRSTDNSYVPMALTADMWSRQGKPITLLTDVFAVEVHAERSFGQLHARGVTWQDNATGRQDREDARVVVLAAGCTETPRLWLGSGLPDPNGWVGRGYTDHFMDCLVGVFDTDTGNSKGPASAARADYPGYGCLLNVGLPPAMQALSMTLSDSGIRGQYTNGRGWTGPWDGAAGRLIGRELKAVLAHGVDRLLNLVVITDDDVQRNNGVALSALPVDEHDALARVEIRHRQRTRRTVRNREYLVRRAVALLRAAGAKTVYRLDWAPLLLHTHSAMRMGGSERDSVLDANAESRAVRRLFVADNSALANSVGGVNPTLTTQALATRTAEKIFHQYFSGSPWVRHESAVISTDPRITTGGQTCMLY